MSGAAESISLEETNRIRISMGLKPLADPNAAPPPSTSAEGGDAEIELDDDAIAQRNYHERMEREKKERDANDARERIAKAQNRLALNAKLKGQTLGAAAEAEDDEDALGWIKKQRKRAKKLAKELEMAKQREAEQAELERGVYGEEDLRGLKVSHAMDDVEEGQEMILTLKDSRILDGEEDELQNVNLADYERDRAAKERKRKAKEQYTGYDDEEFEEGRIGKKRDVLSKYDDAFMGAGSTEGFRLGGSSSNAEASRKRKMEESAIKDDGDDASATVNRQLLSLDYATNFEVSDYATEDTTFKKKKKKVKRSTRRVEGEGEEAGGMEEHSKAPVTIDRTVDENLVDDDDLQLALARQRRQTAKARGGRRADDVAAQVLAIKREQEEQAPTDVNDGGMTFDDTSEFVRNVSLDNLQQVKREPRAASTMTTTMAATSATAGAASPEDVKPRVIELQTGGAGADDVEMANGDDDSDDEEEGMLAEMALRQGLTLEEMRAKMDEDLVKREQDEANGVGPDAAVPTAEQLNSGGLAGVLANLRNTGALQKRTAEDNERERIQRERDLWLADHRRRVAERELERIKARGGAKDQAQREWENKVREQQEAREAVKEFENYKPDINIQYTDEFGRIMNKKEAWKSLSHIFHHKTSGRRKTELRLRRIEEERRTAAAVNSDTSSKMLQAFAKRQEQTGEAYMTLSVGNRS